MRSTLTSAASGKAAIECAGIKTIGERVVDQEIGYGHKVPLVGMFDAKALQCAQVIPIAELVEEFLLNGPETVPALGTEFTFNVVLEIVLDAIVSSNVSSTSTRKTIE